MLVVNDHALKARWPGTVTGKLSDVAGLAVFPLLLVSLAEVVLRTIRRPAWLATPRTVLLGAVATAAGFSALKVSATARRAYLQTVEALTPISHQIIPDATDLLTLPSVLVAWAICRADPIRRSDRWFRPTPPARPGREGR